jgi:hypothetical protein
VISYKYPLPGVRWPKGPMTIQRVQIPGIDLESPPLWGRPWWLKCNNKSNNTNNRGNWHHLQNIQKAREQHTGMHKMKRLQKTVIFGYCTHILESTNVKWKTFNMESNMYCKLYLCNGCNSIDKHGLFQVCNCQYPT